MFPARPHELRQLLSGLAQRRFQHPHEEIHRLSIELFLPRQPRHTHRLRRRTKRAVVEIRGILAQVPLLSPMLPGRVVVWGNGVHQYETILGLFISIGKPKQFIAKPLLELRRLKLVG